MCRPCLDVLFTSLEQEQSDEVMNREEQFGRARNLARGASEIAERHAMQFEELRSSTRLLDDKAPASGQARVQSRKRDVFSSSTSQPSTLLLARTTPHAAHAVRDAQPCHTLPPRTRIVRLTARTQSSLARTRTSRPCHVRQHHGHWRTSQRSSCCVCSIVVCQWCCRDEWCRGRRSWGLKRSCQRGWTFGHGADSIACSRDPEHAQQAALAGNGNGECSVRPSRGASCCKSRPSVAARTARSSMYARSASSYGLY